MLGYVSTAPLFCRGCKQLLMFYQRLLRFVAGGKSTLFVWPYYYVSEALDLRDGSLFRLILSCIDSTVVSRIVASRIVAMNLESSLGLHRNKGFAKVQNIECKIIQC